MHEEPGLSEAVALLPVPSPRVIFRSVAEGGVLFSTDTEIYFGVNAVGARIWDLLPPASATVGELCATMALSYPEAGEKRIGNDVRSFLEELIAHGLVVTSSANAERLPAV